MIMIPFSLIEGSLEVKLPTLWTDEKQRWEESAKSREEERRSKQRKSQKKEDPGARKGRKVAKHCACPMMCGFGGSKSRLAKAAGAEPAGQMRDEKLPAVVARSTFGSQNAQSTPFLDHFWKLKCRKSARCCGAKHISKSKCTKHLRSGPLLEVEMSKKCTPFWREAHFEVKMYKTHRLRSTFGSWDVEKVHAVVARNTHARTTFEGSDVVLRGRCQGFYTAPKMSKTWGFYSISQNEGRHGTFEEDLERCISRGRRSARDMFVRAVRRSGRWFPERGGTLEHEIFGFGKLILCDRCSTSYDLASLFRDMDWKNRKTHWYEAVSSALSLPLLKEVSQNCFVFWCCQLQKLRKSRGIASFLMLSS